MDAAAAERAASTTTSTGTSTGKTSSTGAPKPSSAIPEKKSGQKNTGRPENEGKQAPKKPRHPKQGESMGDIKGDAKIVEGRANKAKKQEGTANSKEEL